MSRESYLVLGDALEEVGVYLPKLPLLEDTQKMLTRKMHEIYLSILKQLGEQVFQAKGEPVQYTKAMIQARRIGKTQMLQQFYDQFYQTKLRR